jgi:hypothetical protein
MVEIRMGRCYVISLFRVYDRLMRTRVCQFLGRRQVEHLEREMVQRHDGRYHQLEYSAP